jgi:hypothetical protein
MRWIAAPLPRVRKDSMIQLEITPEETRATEYP